MELSRKQPDRTVFTRFRQDLGMMKIPESMPKTLSRLMSELAWTRNDLSLASGLRHQRLSEILRGVRWPNRQELTALSRALGVSTARLIHETLWHARRKSPLSCRVERTVGRDFGLAELYLPPTEMTFAGRLVGARRQSEYEDVLRSVFARLDQRPDRDPTLLSLVDLPCGSGAEATFVFRLLDLEARVVTFAPLALGVCDTRLRDPRSLDYVGGRPMRALAVTWSHCTVVFWPQVPMRTGSASYNLDYLLAAREGNAFAYGDYEIDGLGHDGNRDAERQSRLALPTLRLGHHDLVRPDFACLLKAQVQDLLARHGRQLQRRLRAPG